jgi:hypothetical protein
MKGDINGSSQLCSLVIVAQGGATSGVRLMDPVRAVNNGNIGIP